MACSRHSSVRIRGPERAASWVQPILAADWHAAGERLTVSLADALGQEVRALGRYEPSPELRPGQVPHQPRTGGRHG